MSDFANIPAGFQRSEPISETFTTTVGTGVTGVGVRLEIALSVDGDPALSALVVGAHKNAVFNYSDGKFTTRRSGDMFDGRLLQTRSVRVKLEASDAEICVLDSAARELVGEINKRFSSETLRKLISQDEATALAEMLNGAFQSDFTFHGEKALSNRVI